MVKPLWSVHRVPLPCPSCGHVDLQMLGKLIGENSIPCVICDEVIDISDDEWQASLKVIADTIGETYIKTDKSS